MGSVIKNPHREAEAEAQSIEHSVPVTLASEELGSQSLAQLHSTKEILPARFHIGGQGGMGKGNLAEVTGKAWFF